MCALPHVLLAYLYSQAKESPACAEITWQHLIAALELLCKAMGTPCLSNKCGSLEVRGVNTP